jgi:hypothetical protein
MVECFDHPGVTHLPYNCIFCLSGRLLYSVIFSIRWFCLLCSSAVQSGHLSHLQTGGSPDGMQSFWPCLFRKNKVARTVLRRSRSPGLQCGRLGRPPTSRIVPQYSWALPECLTGQRFSILLLLFRNNLTPPVLQRQRALRQAVVGAWTVVTSRTAWGSGGLRGRLSLSVRDSQIRRAASQIKETAVSRQKASSLSTVLAQDHSLE